MNFKKSNYNFLFQDGEGFFIYNSLSNNFAKMNEEDYLFFQNLEDNKIEDKNIPENRKELLKSCKRGRYIVDEKLNEINYLKVAYWGSKYNGSKLAITIAPTLDCNFRCPYCFESDEHRESLKKKDIENLIDYVKENLKGKSGLEICWYGGEPLMAADKIDMISKELIEYCDANQIFYQSSIVTNGFLLSEEMVKRMYHWRVKSVQVTVDGPEEIHNKTRYLKNGMGTYTRILENIKNSCEFLNISIRINVSQVNKDYVEQLLVEFREMELHKKINVYLAMVEGDQEENGHFKTSCVCESDFSDITTKIYRKAIDLGFTINLYPSGMNMCGVVTQNSAVIAGDGYIYKCWNNVGKKEEAIGTLENWREINGHAFDWQAYSPFEEEECLDCKVLPICYGKCPYYRVIKKTKSPCTEHKYNLIETLKLHKFAKNIKAHQGEANGKQN